MKKSMFKNVLLSGLMMSMSVSAVLPSQAKALSLTDVSQAASGFLRSVGSNKVVAASMQMVGHTAAFTKQAAINAFSAQQKFAKQHPFMMTGAKMAAVAGLSVLGVPTWLAAPALMASGNLFHGIASGYLSHVMSHGAMSAIDLWAPSLLENQAGAFGIMLAAPMLSHGIAKAAVSSMVSMGVTGISYAKKNPVKATAAVAVAGLAAWYGAPYIRDALYALGDTTLSATKAVIDHGSGSIKGAIVTYNPFTVNIVEKVNDAGEKVQAISSLGKHSVSLSDSMKMAMQGDQPVKMLDRETMKNGVAAVKELVEKAKAAGLSQRQIVGVATAWAREGAVNMPDYMQAIQEQTGLTLAVASQADEGLLGLLAAKLSGIDTASSAILDTGGGSLQLSAEMPLSMTERFFGSGESGSLVYGTKTASETFANQMREDFGLGKISQAWPMDNMEWITDRAIDLTRAENTALTGDVLPQLQDIVSKQGDGSVTGIGNVYAGTLNFIKHLNNQTTTITEDGLTAAMEAIDGRSIDEVKILLQNAGLPGSIAPSFTTNLPLVRGIMKAFNVESIKVADVNSGLGAILIPKFWKDSLSQTASKINAGVELVGAVDRGVKESPQTVKKKKR